MSDRRGMLAPFAELYPFVSHFHPTPAGALHYLDEGPRDAPVLLMLHGNPTWSFYFRELILGFRANFRVIAVDHIGAGLSDKPADFSYRLSAHIDHLESLVAELGLERFTLVVHDWGGAIGMGLAVRHPERVARIVVFNTAAFLSQRIPPSINVCRIPGFGALAIRGLNAFARAALIRAVVHQERLTKPVRAGYLAPYRNWSDRIGNLRFVQDIPLSPAHPSYDTLAEIDQKIGLLRDRPMMIIWGAQDFCFDDTFYAEWRRRFPDAEAHHLADAGHYVVEDAHERIVPWLADFFAKTAARAGAGAVA